MTGPGLEVCFSPFLLPTVGHKPDRNVVVVDILRATTAMCTAFGYGVASLLPLITEEEALVKKQQGWLVAGEKDGVKLPFADFGNSPVEFRNPSVRGKDIVYCTTNGTRAIHLAKNYGKVIIASFVNMDAVCSWLKRDGKDVLILCAGWKDTFSLEDAVFAGVMADLLTGAYGFMPECDATIASITLWNQASNDIMKTVSGSSHFLRLLGIENRKSLKYCFYPEKFHVIPMLVGDRMTDLLSLVP
jgi:2-phosphosulfolactate phosphatase